MVWLSLTLLTACAGSSDSPPITGGVRVASITLSPTTASLEVGATQRLSALASDAQGLAISGKAMDWSSSNVAVATVVAGFNGAVVTAVAPGNATITAAADGISSTVAFTVLATRECSVPDISDMAVGEVRTLTASQKALLCVGASGIGAEYKLVLLNIGAPTSVTLEANGTAPIAQTASLNDAARLSAQSALQSAFASWSDVGFMQRSAESMGAMLSDRAAPSVKRSAALSAAVPNEGDIVTLRADFSTSGCTGVKTRTARVVKVTRNLVVYADETPSSPGYTNAQMAALAATFDTLVYPMDTLNYGLPGDLNSDGHISVFFTPAVYVIGALGVFTSRDLESVTTCPGSNEQEMVYLGVPETSRGSSAGSVDSMFRYAPYLFAHELQHAISHNLAGQSKSLPLNEAISYSSAELLFYKFTGLTPRSNIGRIGSPEIGAELVWSSGLQSNYLSYVQRPDLGSVLSTNVDALSIGSLWHLMRFAIDRQAGDDAMGWRALTRATQISGAGAVFGNFSELLRAWAVSHVVDDVVPNIATQYTFPSWNLRANVRGTYPLTERELLSNALTANLGNSGAAYFRFRVNAGSTGAIRARTNGNTPTVDMMLVRAK